MSIGILVQRVIPILTDVDSPWMEFSHTHPQSLIGSSATGEMSSSRLNSIWTDTWGSYGLLEHLYTAADTESFSFYIHSH